MTRHQAHVLVQGTTTTITIVGQLQQLDSQASNLVVAGVFCLYSAVAVGFESSVPRLLSPPTSSRIKAKSPSLVRP
eukprot:CAMPEP_0201935882 /NCGR_PEP_ID=MMETSP0903-20130614/36403_1 /ASSEMBLY_ACC=CAM_ASM_000552 /TAXON_ID=420261 /ORGANISM="Thalassiosira antarctica, Strain CCMP982" /LENGTH=75 /DNA_ID=CAMNT_0048476423 /DNA_START=44 /DNA_END=267 /DNA_ORIENTATION=-